MDQPIVFERDARVYIVGNLAPIQPNDQQLEEFAFAEVVKAQSPNGMLLWLQGQYVEADLPNRNGQLWSSQELSIASLTPRLMPVSVMHNPRETVGLIADTRLLTPDANQIPRARLDTALAVWRHRYPEVCEEAIHNYEHGTLMQSMECLPSWYACGDCGKKFVPLGGKERANWCEHLRGETAAAGGRPVRRLGDVTFTGTGLIFGTRGARGANDKAHLQTFCEEVAEFHERAHSKPTRRTRRMETIEIPRSEYDELKAQAAKTGELKKKVSGLEETAAKVPDLERKVDQLEIDKKAAGDQLAAANTTIAQHEETARAATLSSERLSKLGEGFKAKLPDSITAKLEEQAKSMSDEDWTGRVAELAELTGVKADEGAAAPGATPPAGTFSKEELARAGAGGTAAPPSGSTPSRVAVSSVIGGLMERNRPKQPEPAQK